MFTQYNKNRRYVLFHLPYVTLKAFNVYACYENMCRINCKVQEIIVREKVLRRESLAV